MSELHPTPAPRWAQVAPAETPSLRSLTTLAGSVVIVAALYFGREVLIPITLAILLSFVLAPLADWLRRAVGRIPAVILSVLIAVTILLALAAVMGMQVAELANDIPRYQTSIRQKVDTLRKFTTEPMSGLIGTVGREVQKASKDAAERATPAAPGDRNTAPLPVEVQQPNPSPLDVAERVVSPVLSPLASTAIILIVAVFILLQQEDLRDRLIRLFGSRDLHRTTVAMDDAARRLSRYFLTQLGINAAFGLIIGVGLFLIGIPSPVLWGVLAALLRFVPYVGSLMAGVIPVLLGAAVDPGWSMAIGAAALFLVTEPIMGQIVEPMLYSRSTGLSPVSVVVSAIFWAWLWGPIGLILATPLTLCLVVLGRHIERLEFLDVVLGDRPALTPVENFYQRVLSGDPDEALEQAELLLKERSLSSYYDEVAIKGLRLAATDVLRQVVTPLQLDRIRDALADLVEGLDDHPDADPGASETDKDVVGATGAEQRLPMHPAPELPLPEEDARPPEWRSLHPVLCIGGRGPFDGVVVEIFAQLLQKHAIGTRLLSREAVSRALIGSLDTRGVAMVFIGYLERAGSPAELRYVVRRIRSRLPDATIVVGLWPEGDPILQDRDRQKAVGADHYVTSLRDAVTACLETAQQASVGEPRPTEGSHLSISLS